jgi:hypothetical protein
VGLRQAWAEGIEVKAAKGVPEEREKWKVICVYGMIILKWNLKLRVFIFHLILIQ